MWPSKWTVAFPILMVVALLAGCGNSDTVSMQGGDADIVAVYQGGKISDKEFTAFKSVLELLDPAYALYTDRPEMQKTLLEQLIAFHILEKGASEQAKKEGERTANMQMAKLTGLWTARFGSVDEMKKQLLEHYSVTPDDARLYLTRSTTVVAEMRSKVTEELMRADYEQKLKTDRHAFDVATVSHILVALNGPDGKAIRSKEEALQRIREIADKIKYGADFAALAKEYSDDPGSKNNGGRYENAEIRNWVAGFRKAAAELPLQQISDPVETEYGYHLIKVDSRNARTYEQVKEQLHAELSEKAIADFVKNQLPARIQKINLPK